jgi:hypothetical protein
MVGDGGPQLACGDDGVNGANLDGALDGMDGVEIGGKG